MSQPEIQSGSNAAVAIQDSYNDVFFLRRSAENSPPVASQIQQKIDEPVETKEISEVSEILEIRETAAAPIVGSEREAAAIAEPSQQQEAAEASDAQGSAATQSTETVAPVETGTSVAQQAPQVEAPVAPSQEPIGLPASFPDPSESSGLEPDNDSGFIKKVFGKFR